MMASPAIKDEGTDVAREKKEMENPVASWSLCKDWSQINDGIFTDLPSHQNSTC